MLDYDYYDSFKEYFNKIFSQFMKIAQKTDLDTLDSCNGMNEIIKFMAQKIESNEFKTNEINMQMLNAIIDYANLLKEKDPYAEYRFSFISNLEQFDLVKILDKRNKKNVQIE